MVAILQPRQWASRCCPILAMQKLDIVVQAPAQQSIQWKRGSDVMEADSKFLVGTYARNPVVLVKGNGCRASDIEGKEYLDMTAGIAVNALGHNHPDLVRAITEQASTLMHVSNLYYSVPQVELAQRLADSSFADRVFFTNSGTEANEAAIKFSRKYHQNNGSSSVTDFLAFNKCFHGRTMGALALTSKEAYRTPFEPVMPGVHFVEFGDIKATKDTLKLGKTAAVFLEPVQGEGGVYSTTAKFCKELRALCDDYGVLLVFDEVQCGLGRTGRLWAHEAYDVHPDIMTLAKPLAGGLPIGAVLVTNAVAAAINTGDHGSTFAGSPLVCKAALAVLDNLQKPGFLENVVRRGNYFCDLLKTKLIDNSHVKEIRAAGLLIGVQLDTAAAPLVKAAQNAGLLVLTAGKGDVVRLAPPLIISEAEIKECVHILEDCLSVLDVKN